jgi:hypothetical protein
MTKPHLAPVTPTTEIRTVARRLDTAPADECRAAHPRTHELEKLIEVVKRNRQGRRDAF